MARHKLPVPVRTRCGIRPDPAVSFVFEALVSGDDRSRRLLLPEPVHDRVVAQNVGRFVAAFVDGLDLKAARVGRVQPPTGGRDAPQYQGHPVTSAPEFRTIADFRRDNRSAFRQIFPEFVVSRRKFDLCGRQLGATLNARAIMASRNGKQPGSFDRLQATCPVMFRSCSEFWHGATGH